jgi:hypothetical protein
MSYLVNLQRTGRHWPDCPGRFYLGELRPLIPGAFHIGASSTVFPLQRTSLTRSGYKMRHSNFNGQSGALEIVYTHDDLVQQ